MVEPAHLWLIKNIWSRFAWLTTWLTRVVCYQGVPCLCELWIVLIVCSGFEPWVFSGEDREEEEAFVIERINQAEDQRGVSKKTASQGEAEKRAKIHQSHCTSAGYSQFQNLEGQKNLEQFRTRETPPIFFSLIKYIGTCSWQVFLVAQACPVRLICLNS